MKSRMKHPSALLLLAAAAALAGIASAQDTRPATSRPAEAADSRKATVDTAENVAHIRDARAALNKWIETQQLASREAKDWQVSREVLGARIELLKQEETGLVDRMKAAEGQLAEATKSKESILRETADAAALSGHLGVFVRKLEDSVRRVVSKVPNFVKLRLKPLLTRIPDDPTKSRASLAERYQNVLGILNDLNKSAAEIVVNAEVRTMGDGTQSEVRVLYAGFAQAWYLSPKGEAGVGTPSEKGWIWKQDNAIAEQVRTALDVVSTKHKPAFVPLPVKIQ